MTTSRPRSPRLRTLGVVCLVSVAAMTACGKKGPPLAPLRLVPNPVTELVGKRSSDQVALTFTLPTANQNGPGPIDLDHVEIFAVTVAPGTAAPANRELLSRTYLAGTLSVKPPPVEGGSTPPAAGEKDAAQNGDAKPAPPPPPPDPRPGPGDPAAFTETLTPEVRVPAKLPPIPATPVPPVPALPAPGMAAPAQPIAGNEPSPPPPIQPGDPIAPSTFARPPVTPLGTTEPSAAAEPGAPGAPAPGGAAPSAAGAPGAAPAAAAPQPPVTYPVRIYVVRGVSKGGRPGPPSARVTVPLLDPPPAPTGVAAAFTEHSILLTWEAPPPSAEPGAPAVAYNVYKGDGTGAPVNPAPLTSPAFESPDLALGREDCFILRSAQVYQSVAVEGGDSVKVCVTPVDRFPPAPPQGLNALFPEGAIELVWEANSEPDIAGYLVLRGNAPDDTLQPLTPEPVAATTYRDATVTAGAHYFYAVVAVDRAGNHSAPSPRVEGTAR